ncbi:DNA cytosine methyltransferase [Nocardia aobensis]|uniref:DNA (cytosine-5-)-methyltransferase n=1 Tax=Nocardia aobensis TaxID=257277 RepID=A0ABW6P5R2_9NOCA
MKIGALFSGSGMLERAAEQLFQGSRIVWHSEVEPAACTVLERRFPGVPNLGDITQIDWDAVEPVDVLCGGFPCTDVSTAGRRAGLTSETRSGLWFHMAKAISALRPRIVLVENVKGLLSASATRNVELGSGDLGVDDDGYVLRAIGAVLGDLSTLGFDAEWTTLRASDVGAAHRRERVFLLAYPSSGRLEGVDDGTGSAPARGGGQRIAAGGSGSEPVELLPTPCVADGEGGRATRSGDRSNELLLNGIARAASTGTLLPTPRATDGDKGGPNQRGSSGDLMLPSAVQRFLPTPKTSDCKGTGEHGRGGLDLRTAAVDFKPQWGIYEPAIRRQEAVTGRPAPSPTEPNTKGNLRLSSKFSEWLMMWPEGWVTDPELALSRNAQLKLVGNGVVPRQCIAAFTHLLDVIYRETGFRP